MAKYVKLDDNGNVVEERIMGRGRPPFGFSKVDAEGNVIKTYGPKTQPENQVPAEEPVAVEV